MDKTLKLTIIFLLIRFFLQPWEQVFSDLPEQEVAEVTKYNNSDLDSQSIFYKIYLCSDIQQTIIENKPVIRYVKFTSSQDLLNRSDISLNQSFFSGFNSGTNFYLSLNPAKIRIRTLAKRWAGDNALHRQRNKPENNNGIIKTKIEQSQLYSESLFY